jgi:catechol 2,3-dioxygenase-like lactoylglutathione lyase family enzyme
MSDEVKVGARGFDHVGLSVRDLAISRKFFCDCLGWRVVGERPDYPAAFVSDGHGVLTQQTRDPRISWPRYRHHRKMKGRTWSTRAKLLK